MAYTRRVNKADIRSLNISTDPKKDTPNSPSHTSNTQAQNADTLIHHNPLRELRMVLLCSLPLVILLAVGSYIDHTHKWVIPLAERLMRLGSL